MTSEASRSCREVLERLRAQIDKHLPIIAYNSNQPELVVPLDRLPMIGQLVQQYIEAEAVFAQATAPVVDSNAE